jgi:hypothetical protein
MNGSAVVDQPKLVWTHELIPPGEIAKHISDEDLVDVRRLTHGHLGQEVTKCHSLSNFIALLDGCGLAILKCNGRLVGLAAVVCLDGRPLSKGRIHTLAMDSSYSTDHWNRVSALAFEIAKVNGFPILLSEARAAKDRTGQ